MGTDEAPLLRAGKHEGRGRPSLARDGRTDNTAGRAWDGHADEAGPTPGRALREQGAQSERKVQLQTGFPCGEDRMPAVRRGCLTSTSVETQINSRGIIFLNFRIQMTKVLNDIEEYFHNTLERKKTPSPLSTIF